MKGNTLRYGTRQIFWQSQITSFILFLANICLLLLSPEEAKAQEIRRALPPTSDSDVVKPDASISSIDEQAKFLAGIPLPPQSSLSALQAAPFYREHARHFSKAWSYFQGNLFNKMQAWSQSELRPKLPHASVLLYMFGGPDFINAFALFPKIPTMVLCGLEPIGSIVPPIQLGEERLASALATLRTATDSTLKWSFFIRKNMKEDLQRGDFRGVLPILYTFLALSDNFIEGTEFTRIGGFPAVRITYRRSRSAPSQILYYINGNLANGASGGLLPWMASLGPNVAYIKAASYLMHQGGFSSIRDFLLKNCSAILQDDSGIPYKYFSPHLWKIYLYGRYTKPIDLFQSHYQSDIHTAYESAGKVESLPFGTGYQWRPGQSNLMLAVRK